jgi:hypothetical protein
MIIFVVCRIVEIGVTANCLYSLFFFGSLLMHDGAPPYFSFFFCSYSGIRLFVFGTTADYGPFVHPPDSRAVVSKVGARLFPWECRKKINHVGLEPI